MLNKLKKLVGLQENKALAGAFEKKVDADKVAAHAFNHKD